MVPAWCIVGQRLMVLVRYVHFSFFQQKLDVSQGYRAPCYQLRVVMN